MSKASIYCVMNKLGFVCKKRNRKIKVYQRLDVVDQYHKNLHRTCQLRNAGYTIYYQDETWFNANH